MSDNIERLRRKFHSVRPRAEMRLIPEEMRAIFDEIDRLREVIRNAVELFDADDALGALMLLQLEADSD